MATDRVAALRNAEKLVRQGRVEQAIAAYLRVVEDDPSDWNTANALGDLYVRDAQSDKAIEQFTRIADGLRENGFLSKAAALYKKVLKITPDNEHAQLQAAEIAAAQGVLVDARSYLNALADRRRKRGDRRGAAAVVVRLGSLDPGDWDARRLAARAMVELDDVPGAVSALKVLAADLAAKGHRDARVEALEEAAALDPDDGDLRGQLFRTFAGKDDMASAADLPSPDAAAHDPKRLLSLAEVSLGAGRLNEDLVAGGLDDVMPRAQAELPEAHLAKGFPADLGEQASFAGSRDQMSDDSARRVPSAFEGPAVQNPRSVANTVASAPTLDHPRPALAQAQPSRHIEIDLSGVLDEMQNPAAVAADPADLDDVLAQMRGQARARLAIDVAEQDLRMGLALFDAGQVDDSIRALEAASRTPRLRFRAAVTLGRIFLGQSDLPKAVEWFERAAESPAPTVEAGHVLLYDLADTLESLGETTRALAVYLELQADAGLFRDVRSRIDRLARAQARG